MLNTDCPRDISGELTKQEGDMSEMYPTTLSEKEIQRAAEEIVLKHGDDAFAEAAKEINASNSRGNFTRAGSWVLVCQRIRELQVLDDSGSAPDKNVMSLE
jgi:hypothetical protein